MNHFSQYTVQYTEYVARIYNSRLYEGDKSNRCFTLEIALTLRKAIGRQRTVERL